MKTLFRIYDQLELDEALILAFVVLVLFFGIEYPELFFDF